MAVPARGGAPVPLSKTGLIGGSYLPSGANNVQWSPDGRWIAFLDARKLEVVSTTGGRPRVLIPLFPTSAFDSFSWSPTSKRLAYIAKVGKELAYGSDARLATVDLQGRRRLLWSNSSSLHYISDDSWDRPQWSPDGSKLVFMARSGPGYPPGEVWIVGANGHELKRIA
jgi:Tol biopolymer transport system component